MRDSRRGSVSSGALSFCGCSVVVRDSVPRTSSSCGRHRHRAPRVLESRCRARWETLRCAYRSSVGFERCTGSTKSAGLLERTLSSSPVVAPRQSAIGGFGRTFFAGRRRGGGRRRPARLLVVAPWSRSEASCARYDRSISGRDFTPPASGVPLYAELFGICQDRNPHIRGRSRRLVGSAACRTLPPFSCRWL